MKYDVIIHMTTDKTDLFKSLCVWLFINGLWLSPNILF